MFLKKGLLFYLTIFFVINASQEAQTIHIKISNGGFKKIKLFSLSGEKVTFIDSINALQNNFTFQINGEKGFYRIVFDKNKSLNFLYENEDIEVRTDVNYILDSLKILKSESIKFIMSF